MNDVKNRSLAELEIHYQKHLEHWTGRRDALMEQARACEQQMAAYSQKLSHVRALVNGSETAAAPAKIAKANVKPPVQVAKATRPRRVKRRRRSPIRDATLKVLRNRPGQRLTAAQIRTAIRKDTHRRASRQAINVNVDILEEAGLIRRARAPKGSGARFVFWAV